MVEQPFPEESARGLSWIVPLPLRPLAPVRNDGSLRRSFWPESVREGTRERETELTATQANHLIGCHSALTFEGCRSISPETRERDEREATGAGEGIGYAAGALRTRQPLINASVYPSAPRGLISPMISTHPGSSASSRRPSPSRRLYRAQRTERGRTEMKGRKKKYSRGRAEERQAPSA